MLGRARPPTVIIASSVLALLGGCGDDTGGPIAPTYENVERVVGDSCTFSRSCHGGTGSGKADLNFEALIRIGTPLVDALVDVPACEYDAMPLVDPGHPENSWLYIKLSNPFDSEGNVQFTPAADWEPPDNPDCPQFGEIMPLGIGDPELLPENEIEMFRQWIEMGAPGPETM